MRKENESKLSFSDRISGFVKVKVTKKEPDALRSLCGEKVQTDKNGNEFFFIPEHQAKYIAETFPKYTVSKGFLPENVLVDLNRESQSNKNEIDRIAVKPEDNDNGEAEITTDLPEGTEIKNELPKRRGNPNWYKKPANAEVTMAEPEPSLSEV